LDELIDAMPLLPEIILVLVGYGEHEVVLKDKVKLLHLEEKVFFLGAKNYPNILGMLQHADLGIALEKPVSESFKWALPNKIFDYARMGLPFVTLGNPEVSSILDKYPMGWVTQSLKTEDLSSFILQCLKDVPNQASTLRAAQEVFFLDNNAEKEWKILESIVE
jgi:glycosyltransferase involved in cell wall biosynthesis